jgi:uncharacterized protein
LNSADLAARLPRPTDYTCKLTSWRTYPILVTAMSWVKAIFWNSQERRIRAGWRLPVQFILFVAALVASGIVGQLLGKGPRSVAGSSAVYLLGVIAVIWLVARFIDRRRAADYGFHLTADWWKDAGFGVLLGVVLMAGIFVAEWLFGWISVSRSSMSGVESARVLALSLFAFLAVAIGEESTSRGYQLRNLAEGIAGRWVGPKVAIVAALLISSSIFGLLHAMNPHATLVSTLSITLAGVLLGLPLVLTGELAISIGLHLSWNFFQGTVFGFPVSGNDPGSRLLISEQVGPERWTGGAFGPEGGLIGIVAILCGCVFVVAWVKLRGRNLAIDVALARYEPRRIRIAAPETLTVSEEPLPRSAGETLEGP